MEKCNLRYLKEYYPLLISVLVLLIVSLFHIIKDDLLIDEASSLLTSGLQLDKVIHRAFVWEEQAPLYYFILALWRLISTNYIFARILSLIFMILSMLVIFRILTKYEKSNIFLTLFLVLFVINFNSTYAAFNIRYYALTILISVILLHIYLDHYLNKELPVLKTRLLFSVLATLAILTQYFTGFLLLAFGLTLLIQNGFRKFLYYCMDMIWPLAVLIVLYSIITKQIDTYTVLNSGGGFLMCLKFILFKIESYIVSFHEIFEINWYKYMVSFIILGILLICLRNYKKIQKDVKAILYIVLIMSVCISIIYFKLGDISLLSYHTLALFFPVLLLLYFVIKLVRFKFQIAILGLLILVNLPTQVNYALKSKTITQLNSFLTENEKMDEPVFIFPSEYKHLIQFHYTGINEMIGIPYNIDYEKGYRINQWAIRDIDQLDSLFTIYEQQGMESFLVVKENNYFNFNFDYHVDSLYIFLKNNYRLEFDTLLEGYLVQKYSISSN